MEFEFPMLSLSELVKVKGGKRLPKGSSLQKDKNSHPYIRVRDMGERYIPDTGLEYVPNGIFPKIQRYIVEENDVLVSIVGTIGLVSVIDTRFHLASQTENCAKLSGLDAVDALYLYYFLSSPFGQQEIMQATVGAVQAKLPLYNIEKIPVNWPNRIIRESIVASLGSLDEKIELNCETNETLEKIAQVIFKSWFVDFEPTRAKIKAKQDWANNSDTAKAFKSTHATIGAGTGGNDDDAQSLFMERAAMAAISSTTTTSNSEGLKTLDELPEATLQQLKTTAAFFPDALVDAEFGEVPEGWGIETLEDVIELAYGKALKKDDRTEGDFPVYGSGGLTGTHNESLVDGPGIIVGRKGTVGALYWEDKSFFPIDTVFYVKCKNRVSLAYVYYLLKTLGLETMNTDAAVPGLNRNNAYRLEIPKTPANLKDLFTTTVNTLRNRISNNVKQTESLVTIRDSLLPKLLSGELPINDAA